MRQGQHSPGDRPSTGEGNDSSAEDKRSSQWPTSADQSSPSKSTPQWIPLASLGAPSTLLALVTCWYIFSYLFNSQLKLWFAAHPGSDTILPLLLIIFFANTVATAIWTLHAATRAGTDAFCGRYLLQLIATNQTDFALLCFCGIVGMAATCIVLQHGSIQLVQVARGAGPLFNAFWAYLMLNQRTTGTPLTCLLTALFGTLLASWKEPTFSLSTCLMMLTINACLSFRNTATKRLISRCQNLSPSLVASALLTLTSAVGLALIMLLWRLVLVLREPGQGGPEPAFPASLDSYRHLILLGFFNFAYNFSSQLVLARVPVVSHGMLELFKRTFVLLLAFLLLTHVPWAWHNAAGAAISGVATLAFFLVRDHAASPCGTDPGQQASGYVHKAYPEKQQELHDRFNSYEGPMPNCDSRGRKTPEKGSSTWDQQASSTGPPLWSSNGGGGRVSNGEGAAENNCSSPSAKLLIARAMILLILLISPLGLWFQQTGPSHFRGGTYHLGLTPYHATVQRAQSIAGTACSSSPLHAPLRDTHGLGPHFTGVWSGWIGRNNLGDEIVYDLFLDLLVAALMEHTPNSTQITVNRYHANLNGSMPGCDLNNVRACDFAVIGGGSTIYADYIKRVSAVVENSNASVLLFGSGHQSGLQTKSINRRYMARLCNRTLIGGVRGPVTSNHLSQFGLRIIPVVRDSAVLSGVVYLGGTISLSKQLDELGVPGAAHLEGVDSSSNESGSATTHRLDESGVPGDGAVGVGSTSSSGGGSRITHRQLLVVTVKRSILSVFRTAIMTLLSGGKYVVVLQSVDDGSAALHTRLAEDINQMLPKEAPPVLVHNEHTDWAAVTILYRRASASLNGRLHSGVLSMSALCPAVYLASNVKYLDLMNSFDLGHLVIDPKSFFPQGKPPPLAALEQLPAGNATLRMAETAVKLLQHAIDQRVDLVRVLKRKQAETLFMYRGMMVDFLSDLQRVDSTRYQALMCCDHIHIDRSGASNFKSLFLIWCLPA